ncbi:MAG TPA: TonB family protein [Thermoanaerobaculia bacterium]|jgi:TonB family protein
MQDRVAEVLARRAALDSGPGPAILASILLHGGLAAAAVWAVLHAPAPEAVTMVNIQFAPMQQSPAIPAMTQTPRAKPAPPKPAEPPKPKPETPTISEPKPEPVQPVTTTAPLQKNTVPLSNFGRSTKKGSDNPVTPAAPPQPATPPSTSTGGVPSDIPIGGSGVAGFEGGDFPYTIYVEAMHRKIGASWYRPQVQPGKVVIIYFRIQRNGTITDAKIETPSGSGTFDRAALSAVISASPLNSLPPGYIGPYLGVHLAFR